MSKNEVDKIDQNYFSHCQFLEGFLNFLPKVPSELKSRVLFLIFFRHLRKIPNFLLQTFRLKFKKISYQKCSIVFKD